MTHRQDTAADLILFNGRVTTLSTLHPEVSAVAVREGKFLVVGGHAVRSALSRRGPTAQVAHLERARHDCDDFTFKSSQDHPVDDNQRLHPIIESR
jgi:hypothetical protein